MLLSLYRACSAGLAPLAPFVLTWRARVRRARLRREDRARIGERLGRPSLPRPNGRIAWLHGATAADIASLLPLIDRLGSAGFHALVTTRDDGAGPPRLPPTALHQFAPLDAPGFVAQFLAYWRPDIALLAGSEFWPNLILETKRRSIPIALVDARFPARAFLFWRRAPRLMGALFGEIDACLARTAADAERFRFFGALRAEAAGDPIYDFSPPPADGPALARLAARIGARPVWAAFPTDAGEEDIAIEAHRKIAAHFPDLVTIIAPRGARRCQDVALRAGKLGLKARVAAGEGDDGPLPAIHIARALEAGLFYRLAGVVFLGKSLGKSVSRSIAGASGESTNGGGLNPVEAAKFGCAILHGPNVGDFEDAYAALDAAGGCALVHDAATLASEVSLLLLDSAELREMGRAASDAVERRSGASTRIMQAIAPWLAQAFIDPDMETHVDDGTEN
jgi:3-deoxy-D-manno-octulosonic-acid transferase